MHRNKHWRRLVERNKQKRLYHATKFSYGVGAYYDKKQNRLRKYSLNSAGLRRALNRSLRRKLKEDIVHTQYEHLSPGMYRKMKDYWWELL